MGPDHVALDGDEAMRKRQHLAEALALMLLLPLSPVLRLTKWLRRGTRSYRVLIQGWYGSETIGDVAILGQLIREWQAIVPGALVLVATFDMAITKRSLDDLDADAIEPIGIGFRSAWHILGCNILLFGGGPLMESRMMPFWLLRAIVARASGAKVIIHGCGIGPVRTKSTEWIIRLLLRTSNVTILRDRLSREWAGHSLTNEKTLVSCDPALDYVRSSLQNPERSSSDPTTIGLFLRDVPDVYSQGSPSCETETPITQIAEALTQLSIQSEMRFVGFIMQEDFPEDNDRSTYRGLSELLGTSEIVSVKDSYHSLQYITQTLADLDGCITVRFHGAVFAIAANLPLVALDYTHPLGKVSGAMDNAGRQDYVLPISGLTAEQITNALKRAISNNATPCCHDYAASRIRFLQSRLVGA